jgi:proline iminopeptidase
MRTAIRWTLRILAGTAALAAVALGAGFLATSGDRPVLRTVADDSSLPSAVIDGVKLHVRTFGDPSRPAVVVVHGGPGNDSRYLLPLSALADRYHVVFYDQRGSGLSERVGEDRLTLEPAATRRSSPTSSWPSPACSPARTPALFSRRPTACARP